MSDEKNEFNLESLQTLLEGEAAKMAQHHASVLVSKYAKIHQQLIALQKAVNECSPKLGDTALRVHDVFDPGWDAFDVSRSDLEEFSLFKFLNVVGHSISTLAAGSSMRLYALAAHCQTVVPILTKKQFGISALSGAEESANQILALADEEFEATVLGFDKLVGGVYLATRREYKRLRRKFLGEASKQNEERDPIEDHMMMQLFGVRPPQQEPPLGPATALIDENCVLTQLLTDAANVLPKYYERVVPIVKRGVATSQTKTMKYLDDGEVDDAARTIARISHPTFVRYAMDPGELLDSIMGILQKFFNSYSGLEEALRDVVERSDLGLSRAKKDLQKKMANPRGLARQYSRINFLSIRPVAEDVTPRTRMERDYAEARTKLLEHLKETILALSKMKPDHGDTEAYAVARTREAVELKSKMDEVTHSDRQKSLERNIRDDNEFYVSKGGNLGSLESEREPAPKIRYEDVIGDSFVKAKAHVEEVVEVASHPHIMRISAPRGDVKSNILLIGPYGCGKTEMAKAIGGDKRIIGFNVTTADLLTAYMHESVKNVKRMFDNAKDMRRKSRYTKPVGLLIDEFDRLFSYGEGVHQAYDGPRMTGIMQEMMDGVVGYEGVFMVALTNVPKEVPEAILRRFKFVDVVGQLTREERAKLFKMFLTRGLPLAPSVTEEAYLGWAETLVNAPGDVIGKVADEIHFKFMKEFVAENPSKMASIERALASRLKDREARPTDHAYVKKALGIHKQVGSEAIGTALEAVLKQPQVQMQINKAREVYRDAEEIMAGLSVVGKRGLGFEQEVGRRSKLWSA